MKYQFTKMHGAGNDYIYFDWMQGELFDPSSAALKLSDRHFGVGGDGIVLICASDVADAKMRMFNADGSEGKMCGNAVRCVGKYLYDKGIAKKDIITIETQSGIKTLKMQIKDGVATGASVDMGYAEIIASKIPVISESETVIDKPITVLGQEYRVTCVSMGNPHCVIFGKGIDSLKLEEIGPHFENYKDFPERINTEFIEIIDKDTIKMRVWERGSGETMACGTGACASVVACVQNGFCQKGTEVTVKLRGGDLKITYREDGGVTMTGPAKLSFEGKVEI